MRREVDSDAALTTLSSSQGPFSDRNPLMHRGADMKNVRHVALDDVELKSRSSSDAKEFDGEPDIENGGIELKEASWQEVVCEKGFVSNVVSCVVMIIGLAMRFSAGPEDVAARYVLSFGLFGFAGGVTNWLAVKMLFDEIPLIYGSGVIPRRFKEIRKAVKNTIMTAFFNPSFLRKYLREKIEEVDVNSWIKKMLESESVSKAIDEQLAAAFQSQEARLLLQMAGINPQMVSAVVPLLKPFISNMAGKIGPKLKQAALEQGSDENILYLRAEVDKMMTAKLKMLTPDMVKRLMEDVMRKHLSWLVIWGNVFGALIGVICAAIAIP